MQWLREFESYMFSNPTLTEYLQIVQMEEDGCMGKLFMKTHGKRRKKHTMGFRKLSYALALAMTLTLLSPSAVFFVPLEVKAAGTANDVVSLARSQIGNSWTSYMSSRIEWCGFFVGWCLDNAGVPQDSYYVVGGNRNYVPNWQEGFADIGRWHYRGTYTPKPGDLIVISTSVGPRGHIGIVESVDDDSLNYIAGNENDVVNKPWLSQSNSKIYGYCEMLYNSALSDTTRPVISNAKITKKSTSGYRIEVDVTDDVGIDRVQFPTWPSYKTSAGCTWYKPTSVSGNHYVFDLSISDFNYYAGSYTTHVYAYDTSGNYEACAFNNITPLEQNLVATGGADGHIFELYDSALRWTEAKKIAEEKGGHLATITDIAAQASIYGLVQKGGMDAYWLGATDESSEGTFKWVTGEAFSIKNFASGQPDNGSNSDEYYLGIWKKDGTWNDFRNAYVEDVSAGIGYIIEYEPIEPTSVDLSAVTKSLTVGSKATLTAIVMPTTATVKTVTWSSSNTSIATVSSDGEITAVAPGIATITATAVNGVKNSCTVKVEEIPLESIQITGVEPYYYSGDYIHLGAKRTPSNATERNLKWSWSVKFASDIEHDWSFLEAALPDVKDKELVTISVQNAKGTIKDTVQFYVWPQSGYCNTAKTSRYEISPSKKELRISGSGAVETEVDCTLYPWTGNTDIKKIVIESGITEVDECLTHQMSNVEELTLPAGLKKINDSLIYGSKISSVDVPDSVESIYGGSFYGSSATTCDIYFYNDAPKIINGFAYVDFGKNAVVHVPSNAKGYDKWNVNILYDQPAIGNTEEHEHTYKETKILPTCEKEGKITYICTECGDEYIEMIEALGHRWDEGVVVKKATETDEGEILYTCLNDSTHTKTETIPKLAHTHVLQKITASTATCTEDGNKEYYVCSTCKNMYSDIYATKLLTDTDVKIPATGHDWGEWVVTKPAEQFKDGLKTRTCKHDSSHVETAVIPKTADPTDYFIPATQISLEPMTLMITRGANVKLNYAPANANVNPSLRKYESSDTSIATVDYGGFVHAISDGTATITVKIEYPDGTVVEGSGTVTVKKPTLKYRAYVQKNSWMPWQTAKVGTAVDTSNIAGTTYNLRMETIQMQLSNMPQSFVQYRAYCAKKGWTQWADTVDKKTYAGTKGESRRIEMIQIKAKGLISDRYDIYYRTYCEKFGWLGWAKNGAKSGSAGYARKLEAFQVQLVKKGTAFGGGSNRKSFYDRSRDGE